MEAFLKNSCANDSKNSSKKLSLATPWVEKYRPKSVVDVTCQDEIVSLLKKSIDGADLPNLLFYGPPGTGKTSTIIAAAKDLFGIEGYKERVLELNASDERGINVIREKVKTFAQNLAPSYQLKSGKTCPAFKIIILDEADSMTSFAQAALRRIMEKESKTTRFCIICNYITRIIDPITSRCAKFRFKPLESSALTSKLKDISQNEGVLFDNEKVLDFIVEVSGGDMRMAITYLQSAFRFVKRGQLITNDDICEIAGVIPKARVDKVIKFYKTANTKRIIEFVEEFMQTGYAVNQLIFQLVNTIIKQCPLDESQHIPLIQANCTLLEQCGQIEYKLLDGADEELQLLDLLSFACNLFKNVPE